jgi:hypothetical protein
MSKEKIYIFDTTLRDGDQTQSLQFRKGPDHSHRIQYHARTNQNLKLTMALGRVFVPRDSTSCK